jgi:hypothetical protein
LALSPQKANSSLSISPIDELRRPLHRTKTRNLAFDAVAALHPADVSASSGVTAHSARWRTDAQAHCAQATGGLQCVA